MKKIVFDTNSCRSEPSKHDVFLGYRDEIKKYMVHSEVIIPRIVADEIINQKKRILYSKRDQYINNPFLKLTKMNIAKVKEVDIDKLTADLLKDESIKFTVRDLSKPDVALSKIYDWAINKKPPFSPEENHGDKGFKDAYIACIVDELLDETNDEYILLFTKDDLLTKKYIKNPRVKIISEFEQIELYVQEAFVDEYLEKKIHEELDMHDGKILNGWLNIRENWVLPISMHEEVKLVIVDSKAREILDSVSDAGIDEGIIALVASGNFQNTHSCVQELSRYVEFLSKDQIATLIKAAITNDQIYWIASDEDIKLFYMQLFDASKDIIDSETHKKFVEYFEVKDD